MRRRDAGPRPGRGRAVEARAATAEERGVLDPPARIEAPRPRIPLRPDHAEAIAAPAGPAAAAAVRGADATGPFTADGGHPLLAVAAPLPGRRGVAPLPGAAPGARGGAAAGGGLDRADTPGRADRAPFRAGRDPADLPGVHRRWADPGRAPAQ